jgi:hypothetical protein
MNVRSHTLGAAIAPTMAAAKSHAPQRSALRAGRSMPWLLAIVALCLPGVVADTSAAFGRPARLPLRLTVTAPACSGGCVDARGRISCPHFLTTTSQWPCAQYWVVQTPCGPQLQRVFACW